MRIYYFTLVSINLIVSLQCARFHDYDLLEDDTKSGYIAGDYIIGALFPIHDSFDDEDYQCNFINEYDGIQIMEAAFFAIDSINRNKDILPNVTLGIDIRDDCNAIEVAILQSKRLIDKSVSRSNETEDIFSYAQKGIKSPLIGIIGPENGVISMEVQSVLKFFAVVQIGYSEPLTDFIEDQIDLYPYFFSVISGSQYMTEAIIDILMANNWTYVSLVHSTDSFGVRGLKNFHELATDKEVCIADVVTSDEIIRVVADISEENYFRLSVSDIMPSYEKVDVIVCYCSPELINLLFRMIKDASNSSKRFVVIGGDGWSPSQVPEHQYQDVAVGEILVSLDQPYIKQFDDYYLNLNLQNNKRNPWFKEFWEHHFKCEINPSKESESLKCLGNETLKTVDYKQNPKVPYVIESVFVFAQALHDMLGDGCEDVRSGKLSMNNAFYKSCYESHVKFVKFDFYGEPVEFDFSLRVPKVIKYNYHNFQRLENGSYDYVKIGEYYKVGKYNDAETTIMKDKIVYPQNKTSIKSSCNEPCSPKHAKVLKKDKCCWDCVLCKPLEILVDSTRCVNCAHGFMSDALKTHCIPIPMEHIKWHDVQIIISLCLSTVNIVLIGYTTYVFIMNEHTPVVKSSTKELCYVMFFGMFLANLTPYTILSVPNVMNCVVIRVLPPISFTLIYAALLVKTNRIARILAISKKKFPNLNPKFLSLKAQVTFTIILITIQIIISIHSLYKYSVDPVDVFRQRNDSYYGIRICSLKEDVMLENYVFIGVLILICTYYAVKTRNLPENFNEAKYIGFAMYATILTDISFGLIYFGSEVKILAITLCISINTMVVLIFLFAPKLYIVLLIPEKNIRANFITTTNIRCFIKNRRSSIEQKKSTNRNEDPSTASVDTTTTEICVDRV